MNNGDINTNPLFSNAMNAIAVGRTDGQHAINSLPIGGIYTLYRTRPEIVAPMGFTSFSTPVVAAASRIARWHCAQYADPLRRVLHAQPLPGNNDLSRGNVRVH